MNAVDSVVGMRWGDYVLDHGADLRDWWRTHFGERGRSVLYILAKGFDRRMCWGLETLLDAGKMGQRDVGLVEFDEGPASPSRQYCALVEANWRELQRLMKGVGNIIRRPIQMRSTDGRRITARSAGGAFRDVRELSQYTDIVLDISAMPRTVYFPIMAKILYLLDGKRGTNPGGVTNFHVFVWEDAELDNQIRDDGVDEKAKYVHPFQGRMDRESAEGQPKVWMPLLGEGQLLQLDRIHSLVTPDETCPVLPSPATNPRRGDNLILEYREFLFDQIRVEPQNFIYASEENPFEVYRQLSRAIRRYHESFGPLGGARFALSALSSKLMSVGALLAAYDLKGRGIDVAIAHIECQGYVLDQDATGEVDKSKGKPFGLWVAGECYD
jgi:hypothetical protein